ncbi:MAG TPA: BsuPI-related putative proteinase inhibitor [Gemmatimonadaceae bacterium]|nr:BsuPI-related putative proteinase inhibitor [Gemmatimonadaceae bacterium]
MSSRFFIWLLVVGALVLACGPHVGTTESASIADAATRDSTTRVAMSAARKTLTSSVDVDVGEHVALTLHVTNRSDSGVEISFPSGKTHDFVVLDTAGRELWRWSEGRLFTQAMRNKQLDAKEAITFDERWEPGSHHGEFIAIGILNSSNFPVRDSVRFRVP